MVSHIEYLVKPYQHSKDLPINGCADMDISSHVRNPFAEILNELSSRGISPDEYLNKMLELWKARMDYVHTNPDSLFVMIDIFRGDSDRPKQLLDLRSYAVQKLGSRFVSLHSGYETANYLFEQGALDDSLNIHAYGEVSDRCADGETNELIRNLRQLKPDLDITLDFDTRLCPDSIEGKFEQ